MKITCRRLVLACFFLGLFYPMIHSLEQESQTTGSVKLSGPYIFKMDWNNDFLKAGDLNHDGINDFLTINNSNALMSVFLSKKQDLTPEDTFEKQEFVLEKFVQCVDIADLNADGLCDVIISGSPEKPDVLYQNKDGKLNPAEKLDLECQKFILDVPLNQSSSLAFYAIFDNKITLYTSESNGKLKEISEYFGISKPQDEPFWFDVNNDGIKDICFVDSSKNDILTVRLRTKENFLLPEQQFKIGINASLYPSHHWGNTSALLEIENNTRILKVLQYREKKQVTHPFSFSNSLVIGFDSDSNSSKNFIELGDLNSDGRKDVLLVNPEVGNFKVFFAAEQSFEMKKFPAFDGMIKARFIPPIKKKDNPLVAVVSNSEKILAFAECFPDGRIAFPQPVNFNLEPVNFDIADFDQSGKSDLLLLGKTKEGKPAVCLYNDPDYRDIKPDKFVKIDLSPAAPSSLEEKPAAPEATSIPKEEEFPQNLMGIDLNQDALLDIVLFYEFQKPKIIFQTAPNVFTPAKLSQNVQENLVSNLNEKKLFSSNLSPDQSQWSFFARRNFLRAFALNKENEMIIHQQINGKNNKSLIEKGVVLDLNKDNKSEIILLDTYNNILSIYYENNNTWELAQHEDLEIATYTDLRSADFDADGNEDILLLASDRLVFLLSGHPDYEMESVLTVKSDTEDGYYALVNCGQFLSKKTDTIILLENSQNIFEFYEPTDENPTNIKRIFRFKVFSGEENKRSDTNKIEFLPAQPRDLLFKDFNADGKIDLLCLVHDNIILYLQK